jgi:hypothetical protein
MSRVGQQPDPAIALTPGQYMELVRDSATYCDADRFDIARKDVPAILTFGVGAHYCLGANLARRELAEALTVLTRRLPATNRVGPAPWKSLLGMTGSAVKYRWLVADRPRIRTGSVEMSPPLPVEVQGRVS